MIAPADMILFAAVARLGSITRAAVERGVTKQTVSERVGKLEAALGVRLLERTTRSLRLTSAGATYFDRCAAISAQVDDANREVQLREPDAVGLIRVASPPLYGRRFLTPAITRFLDRSPRASVELVLVDRRVNLIEDGLDLAIHLGPLDDSSLVARKLGDGPVHFVASPRYLAKHGAKGLIANNEARMMIDTPGQT
jgi:DNA-binding transcriptional LysR family regulator